MPACTWQHFPIRNMHLGFSSTHPLPKRDWSHFGLAPEQIEAGDGNTHTHTQEGLCLFTHCRYSEDEGTFTKDNPGSRTSLGPQVSSEGAEQSPFGFPGAGCRGPRYNQTWTLGRWCLEGKGLPESRLGSDLGRLAVCLLPCWGLVHSHPQHSSYLPGAEKQGRDGGGRVLTMRGASKQRIGYKNTNVLRKSLRNRLRPGSRQTGVGGEERPGGVVRAEVGGKLMQIRSQTAPAAQGRTPAGSRVLRPDRPERGGAREPCGRGWVWAAGLCPFRCAGWGCGPRF